MIVWNFLHTFAAQLHHKQVSTITIYDSMKKLFFMLCLTLAAISTYASDTLLIRLDYTDPIYNPIGGFGHAPVRPPHVSISDYTLFFWDACEFTLYIKEEDENGDTQVVYITYVPEDQTEVCLPSWLAGTYIIEVARGSQTFVGEIEL